MPLVPFFSDLYPLPQPVLESEFATLRPNATYHDQSALEKEFVIDSYSLTIKEFAYVEMDAAQHTYSSVYIGTVIADSSPERSILGEPVRVLMTWRNGQREAGLEIIPALPQPVAPLKLPELTTCLCQDCEGTGYQAIDEYDAHTCPTCEGYATLEVCSGCGERPHVTGGLERCGCNELCENCGNFPAVQDHICAICWGATLNRINEEGDPNLQTWEELKARDMTPAEVAEQMKEAEVWGWL